MQVCLFLIGASGQEVLPDVAPLQDIDGLRSLIVHEPITQHVDPRIAPAADAPSCVLQLYFDELAALKAAARLDGPIDLALREPLTAGRFTQQVMAVRALAPHAPTTEARIQRCTYLVALSFCQTAVDPYRSDNFLQTGRSTTVIVCELNCREAAVGNLIQIGQRKTIDRRL